MLLEKKNDRSGGGGKNILIVPLKISCKITGKETGI